MVKKIFLLRSLLIFVLLLTPNNNAFSESNDFESEGKDCVQNFLSDVQKADENNIPEHWYVPYSYTTPEQMTQLKNSAIEIADVLNQFEDFKFIDIDVYDRTTGYEPYYLHVDLKSEEVSRPDQPSQPNKLKEACVYLAAEQNWVSPNRDKGGHIPMATYKAKLDGILYKIRFDVFYKWDDDRKKYYNPRIREIKISGKEDDIESLKKIIPYSYQECP